MRVKEIKRERNRGTVNERERKSEREREREGKTQEHVENIDKLFLFN